MLRQAVAFSLNRCPGNCDSYSQLTTKILILPIFTNDMDTFSTPQILFYFNPSRILLTYFHGKHSKLGSAISIRCWFLWHSRAARCRQTQIVSGNPEIPWLQFCFHLRNQGLARGSISDGDFDQIMQVSHRISSGLRLYSIRGQPTYQRQPIPSCFPVLSPLVSAPLHPP